MEILDRDQHRRGAGRGLDELQSARRRAHVAAPRCVHRLVQVAPSVGRGRSRRSARNGRRSAGSTPWSIAVVERARARSAALARRLEGPTSDATTSRTGSRPCAVPKSSTQSGVAREAFRRGDAAQFRRRAVTLPMPGSPRTWTTVPVPLGDAGVDQRRKLGELARASQTKGGAAPASPPATSALRRHAVTGRSMPLIDERLQSSCTRLRARSHRERRHHQTSPAPAMPTRRAARLTDGRSPYRRDAVRSDATRDDLPGARSRYAFRSRPTARRCPASRAESPRQRAPRARARRRAQPAPRMTAITASPICLSTRRRSARRSHRRRRRSARAADARPRVELLRQPRVAAEIGELDRNGTALGVLGR